MIKFPLVSLRKRPGYQFAATWIGYGKRHRHDCQYVDGKTAYGCVQHRVSAHLIFINSPNHLKKYLIIILLHRPCGVVRPIIPPFRGGDLGSKQLVERLVTKVPAGAFFISS